MKPHIKKLKSELKTLVQTIRESKAQFKEAQRTGQPIWKSLADLSRAKYEYRHKHIVRCILRGTPREKIEQPKEENKPSEKYIEKLIAEVLSEALCPHPVGSIEESTSSAGGACGSGVLPEVSQELVEWDSGVSKMSDPRNASGLINRLAAFVRGHRVS